MTEMEKKSVVCELETAEELMEIYKGVEKDVVVFISELSNISEDGMYKSMSVIVSNRGHDEDGPFIMRAIEMMGTELRPDPGMRESKNESALYDERKLKLDLLERLVEDRRAKLTEAFTKAGFRVHKGVWLS